MPIVAMMRTDLASLRSRHIRIFAAAAEQATSRTRAPNCLAAGDADLTQPSALMIGNEGAGLGADLLHFADALISIPMPGPVESLNAAVAGSLLLYEAACQRAGKASNPDLK
jgi:TrmH family RNA methyltransferase